MPRHGPPHDSPYPPPRAAGEQAPAAGPRRRGRGPLAAIAAGLAGGAIALGGAALTGGVGGGVTTVVVRDALPVAAPAAAEAPVSVPEIAGARGTDSIQAVVARSSPAVAKVTVAPDGADPAAGRVGSGFLAGDDGLMLTNAHVVEDADGVVMATFEDGTESPARVLGRDESSDLAVLRVGRVPPGLRPLPLGSSRSLVVGDPLIAIGNPFGLERSATLGIVSALKRTIRAPNGFQIQNVVQTDAAINRGNSGGPLLDARGRVVGVNTQIATGSGGNDGVSFAVPVDTLRPVVEAIVRAGEAEHAWLGVTGRTVTPSMARALGDPDLRGVAVLAVDDRGPARGAGLRPAATEPDVEVPRGGDVIVSVDGRPVADMADVSRAVSSRAVGADLSLTVVRGDRRRTLAVTLADRPDDVGVVPRP